MQVGYMNQFQQLPGGNHFNSNNVRRVFVFHNLDVKKNSSGRPWIFPLIPTSTVSARVSPADLKTETSLKYPILIVSLLYCLIQMLLA